MGGNGRRTRELCVGVHTTHSVGHAVRSGTCSHVVRVEGTARAAAGSNGEVLLAVFVAPLLVSACNGVLEAGRVGGVTGYGNVNLFQLHYFHAFHNVVCAVNADTGAVGIGTVNDFLNNLQFAGVIIQLGLDVGKSVDAADNLRGVFTETVEDNLERLFADFIRFLCNADSAFRRGEGFVSCQECKALGFVAQKHCGKIAVSETYFTLVRNGTGNAETLQTFADGFGGLAGLLAVLLNCDCTADGISPDRVIESDRLNAFHDRFNVDAFIQADFAGLFQVLDTIGSEHLIYFIYSSFIVFKRNCH